MKTNLWYWNSHSFIALFFAWRVKLTIIYFLNIWSCLSCRWIRCELWNWRLLVLPVRLFIDTTLLIVSVAVILSTVIMPTWWVSFFYRFKSPVFKLIFVRFFLDSSCTTWVVIIPLRLLLLRNIYLNYLFCSNNWRILIQW
jgi:hypothetical protein